MNNIRSISFVAAVVLLSTAGLISQAHAAEPSPVFKRAISCSVPETAPTGGGVKFDLFGAADLTGTSSTDVIYVTGGVAPTLVNLPDGGVELLISAVVEVAAGANGSKDIAFKFNVAGYDAILRFNSVTKVSTLAVGDPKQFAVDCTSLLKM